MESKDEQGEREKDGAEKSEEDRQEPCEKRKGYSVAIGSGVVKRAQLRRPSIRLNMPHPRPLWPRL